MIDPVLPHRSKGGAFLSLLLAAAVGGAGLYGGATDALGRAGLAAVVTMLALVALLTPRVGDGTHVRRLAGALGALGVLAFVQTLPLPEAVARVVAPHAFGSRAAGLGVEGGVAISLDRDATRRAATLLLAFSLLVAAVGARIPARAAPVLARALALVAAGHLSLGLALGRYRQEDPTIFGGFLVNNAYHAYGSFPSRAQYASLAVLLLGASIWLVAAGGRPIGDRLLGLATAVLTAIGIQRSGSRMGLAAIGTAVAWAYVTSAERGARRRRVLVVAAVLVAVGGARMARLEPFASLLPVRGDEGVRLEVWRGTLALALVAPVAGIGVEAFAFAYPGDGRGPVDKLPNVAENDALQLLAETGLVGLALAVVAGFAIMGGLRSLRRTATAPARRSGRLALAGPVGFVPLAMTSASLHAPTVALAAIAAGTFVVSLLREEAERPAPG